MISLSPIIIPSPIVHHCLSQLTPPINIVAIAKDSPLDSRKSTSLTHFFPQGITPKHSCSHTHPSISSFSPLHCIAQKPLSPPTSPLRIWVRGDSSSLSFSLSLYRLPPLHSLFSLNSAQMRDENVPDGHDFSLSSLLSSAQLKLSLTPHSPLPQSFAI